MNKQILPTPINSAILAVTIQSQIKKVQEKKLRFAEDLVKEILNDK